MSVTLTNAASVSINGATAENDANVAATYMEVIFPNTVRLFFDYGTTSGQNFVPGSKINRIIVTVDLTTGVWSSTNGVSGTLGGAALTNLKTTVTGWRNSAEAFTVNNSITPGTVVPWS